MRFETRTATRLLQICAITAVAGLALTACAGRATDSGTGEVVRNEDAKVTQVVKEEDCLDYVASPGITDDEIKLGSTFPDSGPLASIGETNRGMMAYFDYLNDSEGGLDGRKITLVPRDDQYDATKAVANVDELLQKENVFGIVGVQSSVGATSIWDTLNEQCIPLMMSTVSGSLLEDRLAHPNTLDGLVPYASEAYALGQYAADEWKSKKVAVIAQSGIFGESFLRGLDTVLPENGIELAGTETYQVTDPTVTAQITNLKATGADTLIVVAAGTKCPQIFDAVESAGWDPKIATTFTCSNTTLMGLASPSAVDDVVSTTWLRSREAGDPESDKYFAAVEKYFPDLNASSENVALGWAQAEAIVEILRQAPALTRLDVINSGLSLKDAKIPMAADGVLLNTSATDTMPIETVRITKFDSGSMKWSFADGDSALIDLDGVLKKTDK
ncbi:ABC transporter substrate-binding protein [Leucobacter allii]|uniref:ABC transporter substrate-binding protein n=1 Tax=Leucobacter allii TaxID=2932247 RepID=UPI001FD20610|nr:ABC transporter substrate-binding protein [Leucobacter allii]UOR01521.1 ABC transporter substrate-binding protein [Leucobacter allii]